MEEEIEFSFKKYLQHNVGALFSFIFAVLSGLAIIFSGY